jgi:diguanylate cyclase
VGQVHARIHLPYHLVARGARQLKWRLIERLSHAMHSPTMLLAGIRFVGQLMDTMLEAMSASYEHNTDHVTRSDEAFRQQALGQNMGAERERQRSNLLEWAQAVLLAVYRHAAHAKLPAIGRSDFGLWIVHKASSIFEGTNELAEILRAMERLDDTLLPQLQQAVQGDAQWGALLGQLEEEIDAIKFQLASLFERQLELENGRDALTRLLNRRFLPSVIRREIQIANKQRSCFALLLIDLDFFKNINDQHGHDAGDSVLQQVATLLQNSVRGGDFVFRYGGEELLVIMVEATEPQALGLAEKIRVRMANTPFLIGNERSLSITTSVGVALFDGHPDYQYLIRRADEALYRAKNGGRNQICLA